MEELKITHEAIESIKHIKSVCERCKPLVVISCITYNHSSYIRDALEGFVMQKTDFPFVAIVHEDASTDNTADTIREYAEKYPDIILPIYEKENQYSKRNGSVGRIMQTAREATGAKYIAYCEGDDYWTDPLKLQKQVDFLESNPDYILVCTSFDKYFQNSKKMQYNNRWGKHGELTFNELLLHNFIATLTIVVRRELHTKYAEFIKDAPIWPFGDYPLWLYASTIGRIMKFSEETAVYRVLDNSASHISDVAAKLNWAHSEFSMFDYFNSRFKIPKSVQREALFNRCDVFGHLAVSTKNIYLINRISNFYKKNHFYIAWISFKIMRDFPKLLPVSDFIETHLSIKSPLLYIKKNGKNRI